jgi:hypothetical protein
MQAFVALRQTRYFMFDQHLSQLLLSKKVHFGQAALPL